jgi:tripeptide aminopeptidase
MKISERFLKYVSFTTTSDENTQLTPSTPGQMVFAHYLVDELKSIGMQDVDLDSNGYIMATLPANTTVDVPTIGFISHMDTSPDMTAEQVKARIIKNFDGNDIMLNPEKNIILSTSKYKDILNYIGQDIIVTDGTTLLGADDKAGLTEIVSAMEYLIQHPEIKHGKIRICFTPDEEIGQGADHFDVQKFGAEWAYTMDGGEIGELEYENFNAASAKVTFKGLNVHPGYAKNKMVNSMLIANQFIGLLPREETPECTQGYQGFFHLTNMEGTVESSSLSFIIRDHDNDKFELRKGLFQELVAKINEEFGAATATVEIRDQYYNMHDKIKPVMHIIDLAHEAMLQVGITPKVKPIRGGTDGSRLSYMGLPCPNIFAGGHNFHGRFEYVPVPSMEKATMLIVKIANLLTQKQSNTYTTN